MKRRIALFLAICLFIVGARLSRLKLRQQKADYEEALRLKNAETIITLQKQD